jgi:hypothetical protein
MIHRATLSQRDTGTSSSADCPLLYMVYQKPINTNHCTLYFICIYPPVSQRRGTTLTITHLRISFVDIILRLSKMEKTFIERRVYPGAEVRRGYRVTGLTCCKDAENTNPVEIMPVQNMDEYSSGCKKHRGCFGHMCITPTGHLLPPQSLSFRAGDIRTQYYIACTSAFNNDSSTYVDNLKKTNYRKEGCLRSIMATPVSGSARLVAVSHKGQDAFTVYISKNLASKILFCLPERDDHGNEGARYIERCLVEGDKVILERPPTLTKYNLQPLTVMYWDIDALGVHPSIFSFFHGDYDGDEVHIYALGTNAALSEAAAWRTPTSSDFAKAAAYMKFHFPTEYQESRGGYQTGDESTDLEFLHYTTLSFSQVEAGDILMPLGDLTRCKADHLRMFHDRISEKQGTKTFLRDAIQGVNDIMRQQLSQGLLGDMSRVARISASCFCRGPAGRTYVISRVGKILLDQESAPTTGSPAVRCTMLLCSRGQQAALDAHRVGPKVFSNMDMVADLVQGRMRMPDNGPCETLCILSGVSREFCMESLHAVWAYEVEGNVVCAITDSFITEEVSGMVAAAYSPVILAKVAIKERREVCEKALNVVFNYHKIPPEYDDMRDVVSMYCYKVEMSTLPITTREGMISRGLGWMETLMACDYTKLPTLAGSYSGVDSATSATMCGNFRYLL